MIGKKRNIKVLAYGSSDRDEIENFLKPYNFPTYSYKIEFFKLNTTIRRTFPARSKENSVKKKNEQVRKGKQKCINPKKEKLTTK